MKRILLSIKKYLFLIVLVVLLAGINNVVFGQVAGDYRTTGTGNKNWNAAATWQYYNGSSWVAASNYPGQAAGAKTVTVVGVTLTLNVSPANSIQNLTINSGASLTITGFSLTVSGTTTIIGTITFANSTSGNKNLGNIVLSGGTWTNSVTESCSATSLTLSGGTIGGSATGSITVSGNLSVTSGTSSTLGRLTITVNGTTTVDGTLNFATSATGNKIFVGLVTISSTGNWNNTINAPIYLRHGITNDGTFTSGTGTYYFNTNDQSVSGNNSLTFNGAVTITGDIAVTNNTTVTIVGVLNGTTADSGTTASEWINAANSVLNLGGTSTCAMNTGRLTATAEPNTVNYNRSNTQTIKATTYYNLTFSGTSAKTVPSATPSTVVNNILSMEGTATAKLTGTLTYGTNATLQYNRTANQAAGNEWISPFLATGGVKITNTGDITLNGAKVFNATAPLTIESGAALAMSTYLLTLNGDLINNGGTTSGTGGVTIAGTATQSIGSYTNSGTTTISKTGGTATFTGNITGGALTINGSGGTLDLGSGLSHSFTGTVTLTAGTLNGGSSTLSTTGAWTNNGATFTPETGTVTFTGSSTAINGTATSQGFNNIIVNKTSGQTLSVGGSTTTLNVGGTFTETTGNFTAPATMTVTGDILLSAGTFTAGTNLTASGDWTNNGATFTPGTGTITFNGSSSAINGSAATQGFYNIIVNKTSGQTLSVGGSTATLNVGNNFTETTGNFTAPATMSVSGDFLHSAGTFTAGANYNISGDWTKNSGTFTPGSGTVTFTGTTQALGGSTTTTFNNLTLSGSGTKTLGIAETVSGALTIADGVVANLGTFTSSANTLTLGTDGTINGSWGNTSSSATNTNNTYFAATTGIINVATSTCTVPTITLGSNPTICIGTTSANLTYSATSGSPDRYSIVFDAAALAAGFVNVTNATLGASPIVITVPASPVGGAGTYSGTLTVKRSKTWCASTGSSISVIITPSLSSVSVTPNTTQTICVGASGTQLTAAETGGGTITARQWGKRSVSGGAITAISGATGSTYTPTGASLGAGTWYVVCTSTPTCGSATISNEVTVTVNANLSAVGVTPSGTQTICVGASGSLLTAAETGGGTITGRQWGKRSVSGGAITAISGATGSTYTPTGASLGAGTWYVVCTSTPTCGSATVSNEVTVTVNANLSAVGVTPSGAQTICIGASGSLLTAAETGGGTITARQWGKRSVSGGAITAISGATGSTYTPTGAGLGTGTWYVVCTSTPTCGSATVSNEVTVTVNANLSAVSVTPSGAQTICLSASGSLLTVAETGGGSITGRQWGKRSVSGGTITAISGATGSTYTPTGASLGAGTWYVVCTSTPTCGSATVSNEVTVTVYSGFTAGAIATTGETICYNGDPSEIGSSTVASGGDGTITYKWQADGSDISGATAATYNPPSGLTATTTYTRWAKDGTCNTSFTQSTGSWVVTVRPIPTATISGTTAVCQNATSPNVTFTNPQTLPITVTYNINGANQTTVNVAASTTATVAAPTTTAGTFVYNLVSVVYQTSPTCSNSITGSATITVDTAPTAPTSITGTTTIYSGMTTTLTAAGGSEGSGCTYQWGTGTTVGSNIISGATSVSYTTPALTTTTTYWVRRVGNTGCTTTTGGVTQQVTVSGTPPTVTFLSASQTSLRESGTMVVTVLVSAAASGTVTIPFTVTGTATDGGTDYTITASPLTVTAGSTPTTGVITITITSDSSDESDETVIVTLGTPTNGVLGATTTHTATIRDDDPYPTGSIAVNRGGVSTDPTSLVNNVLLKGCLTASSVSFTGASTQIGHFTSGTSSFPIAEGIIMSTGNVADAEGPNKNYNTTESGATQNTAALEFDFVPAGNTIEFNYVFASEEYAEYNEETYNDNFQFLLSSTEMGLSETNIALIPSTSTAVAINTVHGPGYTLASGYPTTLQGLLDYSTSYGHSYSTVTDDAKGYYGTSPARYYYQISPTLQSPAEAAENAAYYVDNGHFTDRYVLDATNGRIKLEWANGNGSSEMEYDGRTTKLTATYSVTPCKTYHIKFVVNDVSDNKWDSGVFLEGKSFTSNEVEISSQINGIEGDASDMYEGCEGSYIRFQRAVGADNSVELNFPILVAGTATNGVDFVYTDSSGNVIGDGTFPTSATLAPGVNYLDYVII